MSNNNDKRYCAIIFIGTGSTYHYGPTQKAAAEQAAKWARRDWGKYYKLPEKLNANIIDMKNHDGWYADYRGIYDKDTNEPINIIKQIKV